MPGVAGASLKHVCARSLKVTFALFEKLRGCVGFGILYNFLHCGKMFENALFCVSEFHLKAYEQRV